MPILTTVAFHGLEASDALREEAVKHAQKLDRFAGDISACMVVFHLDTHRSHRPNRFTVKASVSMRGKKIEAEYGDDPRAEGQDMYVALSHVFEVLTRRIEDYVRRRRGDMKSHTPRYPAL